jgi:8-oxo-dGTP diphosphatase
MPAHPSKQDIKVAADAAIFTVRGGELCVLLIQMKKKPFAGRWALPGGLLGQRETSEAAARRILKKQTGVGKAHLEQLETFDEPKRDLFGRVVSVAYMALLPSEGIKLRTTGKYSAVEWRQAKKAKRLAYDHDGILKTAVGRLRSKLEYTNAVWSLLPRAFTLSRLRETYEIILGRPLDKRNFTKKILALGLIVKTGRKEKRVAYRPAELYRFKERRTRIVEVL